MSNKSTFLSNSNTLKVLCVKDIFHTLQIWCRFGPHCFIFFSYLWCDQAKWVWSRNFVFSVFCHFLLGYYLSFNLLKTHGDWAISSQNIAFWVIAKTIKNKRNHPLFLAISKLIFANSDSFCLIASHLWIPHLVNHTKRICNAVHHFVFDVLYFFSAFKWHLMNSSKLIKSLKRITNSFWPLIYGLWPLSKCIATSLWCG